MRITPVGPLSGLGQVGSAGRIDAGGSAGSAQGSSGISFGSAMKKAVGEVNKLQSKADDMVVKLATGDVEDVHAAMIAMNKAKQAFDFTLQVRNKVIEAYQEIMRMQV